MLTRVLQWIAGYIITNYNYNLFFVSNSQALAQCENTLSKLGVAREAVDDTAGAAQVTQSQRTTFCLRFVVIYQMILNIKRCYYWHLELDILSLTL